MRSTGRDDEHEARRRFREIEAEYDAIVDEARRRAAAGPHGIFSRSAPPSALPNDPAKPQITEADARQLARAFFARARGSLDTEAPLAEKDERWGRLLDLDADASSLSDPENPNGIRLINSVEADVLDAAGLRCLPGSLEHKLLHQLLRRALVQLVELERRRLDGDFSDGITDALFCVPAHQPANELRASPSGVSFETLIARYDRERIAPEDVTSKTKAKNRAALAIVARHFGPKTTVGAIDRDAFLDFRDTLAKLPPNVTKLYDASEKLQEIARRNEEGGGPCLNPETQMTYLRLANALLDFAKERRLIEHNEANNLRPIGAKLRPEAKRRPFSTSQLQKIFCAPLYVGCIDDERNFSKPGNARPRRSRFWVPLIALLTGLRMEEILQLTPAHVQIGKDALPFLLIAPGMQVKTENGFREVPIHRELMRIGFGSFVVERRKLGAETLLFDDIPAASDGYRSSVFSKRFATFAKSIDLREDGRRTSFHSFRHNFRDGLRQPSANPDFVREAGGWARSHDTSDIYGDGTPAHLMRSLIDGIEYDVDLSHLYADTA